MRGFDAGGFFFHFAADGVRRHGFGFNGKAHEPLAVHGFRQRAVRVAARGQPAGGLWLGGAAFGKRLGGQRLLQPGGVGLPAGLDAVEDEVFKHIERILFSE